MKTCKKYCGWSIVGLIGFLSQSAVAEEPKDYFNRIVDSIYIAEGGTKTRFPYGIVSIKVSSVEQARRICYNTVRNNYLRWLDKGQPGEFIDYLGSVYCPVGAENDIGLNKDWVGNVKKYFNKGTQQVYITATPKQHTSTKVVYHFGVLGNSTKYLYKFPDNSLNYTIKLVGDAIEPNPKKHILCRDQKT